MIRIRWYKNSHLSCRFQKVFLAETIFLIFIIWVWFFVICLAIVSNYRVYSADFCSHELNIICSSANLCCHALNTTCYSADIWHALNTSCYSADTCTYALIYMSCTKYYLLFAYLCCYTLKTTCYSTYICHGLNINCYFSDIFIYTLSNMRL